ncbi:hypothetical protein AAMO2058_001470000 [Amorphochlora amoebiformis]
MGISRKEVTGWIKSIREGNALPAKALQAAEMIQRMGERGELPDEMRRHSWSNLNREELTRKLHRMNNGTQFNAFADLSPEPENVEDFGDWSFNKILKVGLDTATLLPTFSILPNRSPLKIDCVIFDLDGLLLDSEMASNKAMQKPLESNFGINNSVPLSLHKQILYIKPSLALAKILEVNNISESMMTTEEYISEFHVALEESYYSTRLMPGAYNLIKTLKDRGFLIAVTTASFRKSFEAKMTHHQELKNMFDVIVTGEDPDIKKSKPAPDINLVAMERLQKLANNTIIPRRCLVFDDAPVGIKSAKAAGMQIVGVLDTRFRDMNDRMNDCDLVLFSLEAFDASWVVAPHEHWKRAPQSLS